MVDPVSNEGLSKIAEQAGVDDTSSSRGPDSGGGAGDASFQDVLDGKTSENGAEEAEAADRVDGPEQVDSVDRAEMHEVDDVRDATGAGEGEQVKLGEFVERIADDKAELEGMLEQTMNGGNLDQQQLLEMQTLIYSYSQKVQLTSKVVDKATGGLKQMMNVQV